ncbi:hypothetical protein [Pseudanabaena sp. 'Roaring Creek']|uniref:hypothetical protein n=1 Tax=Pseudanabaena sp. 'Roaring Creek' TaxID=1681830 RepID=UPI0006D7A238|nr:hypothetical protein [Pseudanabaena sp. 'Roaring Creek']
MNPTVIKGISIFVVPIISIAFMRVGNKNPQLFTSLFHQETTAQPRDTALSTKAIQCGMPDSEAAKKTDQQLNDYIYDRKQEKKCQ